MIEIPLTQGKVALVDDCDAHFAAFKWYALRRRREWYAVRHPPKKDGVQPSVFLHREVLKLTDPSIMTDHINRNPLDCRRSNLRIATVRQNNYNRGKYATNTSGFTGVTRISRSAKWQATIQVDGRRRYLGLFATPEAAALAYDAAARQYFGAFARPNFTNEAP